MFARLAFLIFGVGVCACILLAFRQSRMLAAHELAESRLRIQTSNDELQRLRGRVGELVAPERIEGLARAYGHWHPLIHSDEPLVFGGPDPDAPPLEDPHNEWSESDRPPASETE